jgi:type III pantothenate kinase
MSGPALLLDIGNTRIKWGAWRDHGLDETGALIHADVERPEAWALPDFAPDRIIACSVARRPLYDRVRNELQHRYGVEIEFTRSEDETAGVRCGYSDPNRLGADRWMAVLAASRYTRADALVVDAGTAVTIDAVDADMQHLGGYIVPGLRLMERSLIGETGEIQVRHNDESEPGFGHSTEAAVRGGALTAVCGAIERATAEFGRIRGTDLSRESIILTGGDGARIAAALGMNDRVRPHLVLEGVAVFAGLRG